MNERIKQLRKVLGLTQQEFAERVGIKRNAVANYETGRNEPIGSVVNLICNEYNVNPDWLRNGSGEMFKDAPTDELDALAMKYNLTHRDYLFIERLCKDENARNALEDFCINFASSALKENIPKKNKDFPDDLSKLSIDEKVELYRKELKREEKVEEELKASRENA